MLAPRKEKYRKQFRGVLKRLTTRGVNVDFGDYGLKAVSGGWVSSRQIEAARRVITRYTRKGGRFFIRVFPDKPISKKPAETRMGGGKGDVVDHVAVVAPGRILFEISGVSQEAATEALTRAAAKLPVKTRIVSKKGK